MPVLLTVKDEGKGVSLAEDSICGYRGVHPRPRGGGSREEHGAESPRHVRAI